MRGGGLSRPSGMARGPVRCICVLVCIGLGCAGAPGPSGPVPGLEHVDPNDLTSIIGAVVPYDLAGTTPAGLELLDAYIEVDADADSTARARLFRADSHVDLWIYWQVAQIVDPAEGAPVLPLLAQRLAAEGRLDEPEEEEVSAREVSEALAEWVAEDLEAAGESGEGVGVARELVMFDATSPEASRAFQRWQDTASSGPRRRLLLAALLYRDSADWLRGGIDPPAADQMATVFREFSWLCGVDTAADAAELAAACGYHCARLAPPPAPPPTEEREAYELRGDDTPIEFEDAVDGTGDGSVESSDASTDETGLGGPWGSEEPVGNETAGASDWDATPGDLGYELVQACGSEYFGLPRVGPMVLLDEANFLDLVYLSFIGELLGEIEVDLLRGEPLTVLASNLLAELADRFLSGSAPQALTRAVYGHDDRLELPRLRRATPVAGETQPGEAFGHLRGRVLSVRSDGVYLAVQPQLTLSRGEGGYALTYAEAADELHYPGRMAASFHRLNDLGEELIVEGRVPQLARQLSEMEAVLVERGWVSGDAAGDSPEISVLIDGSTRLPSLTALMATLVEAGYRPVAHVLGPSGEQLLELPVSFRSGVEGHRLTLEEGRYSWRAHDAGADAEPFRPDRFAPAPLSALYREAAAVADTDDGQRWPVVLTTTSEQVDFGMAVTVIEALLYRRPAVDGAGDRELLQAPPVTDENGKPVPLFEAGIVIELPSGA